MQTQQTALLTAVYIALDIVRHRLQAFYRCCKTSIGWQDSACGTSVQLSGQPSVEQAACSSDWHRSYTVQGGPASSAVCVHVSSRHAHVRGGGSEHLVRTILYLQGWLIGARARRRERDAAMRPREVSRGKAAGVFRHGSRTWIPQSPVRSAKGCSPCSGGLEGGRRLGHKFKPRRRLSLLSAT